MRGVKLYCLWVLGVFSVGLSAGNISVNSIEALNKAAKAAVSGDTIVLANGAYTDVKISIIAHGSEAAPVVIKAETAGKVLISGKSSLSLAGEYVEINGLYFTAGYNDGDVIAFRNGKEVANHCRITNCVIHDYNANHRATDNIWVRFYGRYNRFDHNTVSHKLNNGCLLVVELNEECNRHNYHRIEYNIFGRRPNYGSNGAEIIRVGNSQYSLTESHTIISHNFFEHCDGEVEIVSIKSCKNTVSYNTFFESAGVLALRHGNDNEVFNNAFIGNGKAHTGGIRIINAGQKVHNNYFHQLKGRRFFAALAIMNGVPNSLPNRYHQVKDAEIYNNSWVDCDHLILCEGADFERTAVPVNVQMYNNIFYNKQADNPFVALDNIDGFIFKDNRMKLRTTDFKHADFTHVTMPLPKNNTGAATREKCGASWFTAPPLSAYKLSDNIIDVPAGQNTLANAVEEAKDGDVLRLSGYYFNDKTITIEKYLRIEKAAHLQENPVLRYNGSRSKTTIITIADGGRLEIDGVDFDGNPVEGKPAPGAGITTAEKMRGGYSAFVFNCSFYNMQEGSASPFKALPASMADTLIFTNCTFHDLAGDAISLSAEKEDVGKYNAEYVGISRCRWNSVLGCALNLYRGGNDESTTGPELKMSDCSFDDVNNREQGSVVRLVGVQTVDIDNLRFKDSGRGGCAIRFEERRWDKISVKRCEFINSGEIKSFFGLIKNEN
ncbi:MAG: polysaccharide lyase 6 family protein [Bacteroidales bacterium]|nr:polysaccharide lyase 6 family protein [Bacteroidales bacterium]MCL2133018.1 polysaccharide lyase 6 family protein [Bacteroidales bacterium]